MQVVMQMIPKNIFNDLIRGRGKDDVQGTS